jgi:hypothetical protein
MHPTAFAKKYLLLWEAGQSTFSLLVAIRYFGWGPVGKVRLILEKLPQARVALYGDARTISLTTKLLGSRHKFSEHPPQRSEVALVIHDRPAAKNIADLNVPVVYVDSLPYMRVTDADIPAFDKVAYYCAQKYPVERLPLASPLLRTWPGIKWVDPIVPSSQSRRGGRGIVVNVGGLHSYDTGDIGDDLVDNAVEAYLNLVLFPLAGILQATGRKVSAVCGNLSPDSCRRLRILLPECDAIGPQTPYAFRTPAHHFAGQHDNSARHGNQFADAAAAAAKSQPNSQRTALFEAGGRHHAMAGQRARRSEGGAITLRGTKCGSPLYLSVDRQCGSLAGDCD